MKRIITIILSVGILGLSAWLIINRQFVVDYVSVWQYQPTEQVAKLASDTTMTEHGRFIFYASQPRLDGTQAFNDACQRQEEGSAILGCYSKGKIFVYDVQDERLSGVKEVTAAHEVLHAVYERLSASERSAIDDELEVALEAVDSHKLQERMDYYARTEPGQRTNELHSILATEFEVLTPALEEHYETYFENRQTVVELHNQYSDKFSAIADSVTVSRQQLEALSTEITTLTNKYNDDTQSLNAKIEQFNARAEAGSFSSQQQFSQERSSLLAEADGLSAMRRTVDAKVAEYERLRARYNSLVDESNSLQQSLDSSLAPAPSF